MLFRSIACDIYVEKEQHASQLEKFKKLTALTQGKKIVALSECGGIPDPDECYKDGAMWSWFMPWYNEHTRDDKYNGEAYFKKLMSNKHVITRDQMPNLK